MNKQSTDIFSFNLFNEKKELNDILFNKYFQNLLAVGSMILGLFCLYSSLATSKTKQKEQERDNKTVDIFDGLTDLERQAIQYRIDDYIAMIESKGEVVSDFYHQNITRKAIAERWGLDEFVKKQQQKQAIKEQKNKEFAERLAEQQREELEKKEREKQRNEIILMRKDINALNF